jgi:hypothetical protein
MERNPFIIGDRIRFAREPWSPPDMIVVDLEGSYVTVSYQDRLLDGRILEFDHLFIHLQRI